MALAVLASAAPGSARQAATPMATAARRSFMSRRPLVGAVGALVLAVVGHEPGGEAERVRGRLVLQIEPAEPGGADPVRDLERGPEPAGLGAPRHGEVERPFRMVGRNREL